MVSKVWPKLNVIVTTSSKAGNACNANSVLLYVVWENLDFSTFTFNVGHICCYHAIFGFQLTATQLI